MSPRYRLPRRSWRLERYQCHSLFALCPSVFIEDSRGVAAPREYPAYN
jgi:hypothetical protein